MAAEHHEFGAEHHEFGAEHHEFGAERLTEETCPHRHLSSSPGWDRRVTRRASVGAAEAPPGAKRVQYLGLVWRGDSHYLIVSDCI